METQEIITYKFNELDDDVKARLIEENRYINIEYDNWAECIIESYKTRLENLGFVTPTINFSGFYSQGDGASFDCDYIDIEKCLEFNNMNTIAINAIKNNIEFYINKNNFSHHYCHEKTRYVDWASSEYIRDLPRIHKLVTDIVEDIEELRLSLCHKIYRELEKEYEYQTRDESVAEYLEYQDCDYLKNGTTI